jgi:hypothetical protein
MKFKVTRASTLKSEGELDITTLVELIQFIEKNGDIIMSTDAITIYDEYVE